MHEQGKNGIFRLMPHVEWLQQGRVLVNATAMTLSENDGPYVTIDFTRTFFDIRFGVALISWVHFY